MIAPLSLFLLVALSDDTVPTESDFYRLVTLPVPEEVVLEVSGLCLLDDGRPLVATRRGQLFLVDGAYGAPESVRFKQVMDGLQEPLGLLRQDEWIYMCQRGELSRITGLDDELGFLFLETICDDWPLSGNYHEYTFGPRLDFEGNFWITTNKPFGSQPFGKAKWRGFAIRVTPDGEMIPTSSGLRSPAGIEMSPDGEAFYTDNQGEWCGASKLAHLEPGDFHGHPHGIFSCEDPLWPYEPVPDPPDGKPMGEVASDVPSFKLPAVWFPYDKMGKSPAGFVWDTSGGNFGPFDGQVFVSDQHHATVMRVFLEEVNGHYQGACFPFRAGFQCGIIRLAWGADGSLLAGETNRGWGSRGGAPYGLERLEWTGRTPFEIHAMRATPDGFELTFTKPLDAESAADASAYRMESYTYLLHSPYGSDEVEKADVTVESVQVTDGGRGVRLVVSPLRATFVHELHLEGVTSAEGEPLLHPEAYYTLIEIPGE